MIYILRFSERLHQHCTVELKSQFELDMTHVNKEGPLYPAAKLNHVFTRHGIISKTFLRFKRDFLKDKLTLSFVFTVSRSHKNQGIPC